MSTILESYDEATNALRKARAINDMIHRVAEESARTRSIHNAADATDDYLAEVARRLKALYEAACEVKS